MKKKQQFKQIKCYIFRLQKDFEKRLAQHQRYAIELKFHQGILVQKARKLTKFIINLLKPCLLTMNKNAQHETHTQEEDFESLQDEEPSYEDTNQSYIQSNHDVLLNQYNPDDYQDFDYQDYVAHGVQFQEFTETGPASQRQGVDALPRPTANQNENQAEAQDDVLQLAASLALDVQEKFVVEPDVPWRISDGVLPHAFKEVKVAEEQRDEALEKARLDRWYRQFPDKTAPLKEQYHSVANRSCQWVEKDRQPLQPVLKKPKAADAPAAQNEAAGGENIVSNRIIQRNNVPSAPNAKLASSTKKFEQLHSSGFGKELKEELSKVSFESRSAVDNVNAKNLGSLARHWTGGRYIYENAKQINTVPKCKDKFTVRAVQQRIGSEMLCATGPRKGALETGAIKLVESGLSEDVILGAIALALPAQFGNTVGEVVTKLKKYHIEATGPKGGSHFHDPASVASARAELYHETGDEKVPLDFQLKMQMSIYLAAWSKAFIILKDAAALRRSGRENSTLYRPLVDLMAAVKDVATLMEMKNGADSSLINTATANGKKHFQEMKAILQVTACRHQRQLSKYHEAIGAISDITQSPAGTIAARSASELTRNTAGKELAACGKEFKNLSLKGQLLLTCELADENCFTQSYKEAGTSQEEQTLQTMLAGIIPPPMLLPTQARQSVDFIQPQLSGMINEEDQFTCHLVALVHRGTWPPSQQPPIGIAVAEQFSTVQEENFSMKMQSRHESYITAAAHLLKMLKPNAGPIDFTALDRSTITSQHFLEVKYLITSFAISSLAAELKSKAGDVEDTPHQLLIAAFGVPNSPHKAFQDFVLLDPWPRHTTTGRTKRIDAVLYIADLVYAYTSARRAETCFSQLLSMLIDEAAAPETTNIIRGIQLAKTVAHTVPEVHKCTYQNQKEIVTSSRTTEATLKSYNVTRDCLKDVMPGEAEGDLAQQPDNGTYQRYALTQGLKVSTYGENPYPLEPSSQSRHLRNSRSTAFSGLGLHTDMNITATSPTIKSAVPKKYAQTTAHYKKVMLTEETFEVKSTIAKPINSTTAQHTAHADLRTNACVGGQVWRQQTGGYSEQQELKDLAANQRADNAPAERQCLSRMLDQSITSTLEQNNYSDQVDMAQLELRIFTTQSTANSCGETTAYSQLEQNKEESSGFHIADKARMVQLLHQQLLDPVRPQSALLNDQCKKLTRSGRARYIGQTQTLSQVAAQGLVSYANKTEKLLIQCFFHAALFVQTLKAQRPEMYSLLQMRATQHNNTISQANNIGDLSAAYNAQLEQHQVNQQLESLKNLGTLCLNNGSALTSNSNIANSYANWYWQKHCAKTQQIILCSMEHLLFAEGNKVLIRDQCAATLTKAAVKKKLCGIHPSTLEAITMLFEDFFMQKKQTRKLEWTSDLIQPIGGFNPQMRATSITGRNLDSSTALDEACSQITGNHERFTFFDDCLHERLKNQNSIAAAFRNKVDNVKRKNDETSMNGTLTQADAERLRFNRTVGNLKKNKGRTLVLKTLLALLLSVEKGPYALKTLEGLVTINKTNFNLQRPALTLQPPTAALMQNSGICRRNSPIGEFHKHPQEQIQIIELVLSSLLSGLDSQRKNPILEVMPAAGAIVPPKKCSVRAAIRLLQVPTLLRSLLKQLGIKIVDWGATIKKITRFFEAITVDGSVAQQLMLGSIKACGGITDPAEIKQTNICFMETISHVLTYWKALTAIEGRVEGKPEDEDEEEKAEAENQGRRRPKKMSMDPHAAAQKLITDAVPLESLASEICAKVYKHSPEIEKQKLNEDLHTQIYTTAVMQVERWTLSNSKAKTDSQRISTNTLVEDSDKKLLVMAKTLSQVLRERITIPRLRIPSATTLQLTHLAWREINGIQPIGTQNVQTKGKRTQEQRNPDSLDVLAQTERKPSLPQCIALSQVPTVVPAQASDYTGQPVNRPLYAKNINASTVFEWKQLAAAECTRLEALRDDIVKIQNQMLIFHYHPELSTPILLIDENPMNAEVTRHKDYQHILAMNALNTLVSGLPNDQGQTAHDTYTLLRKEITDLHWNLAKHPIVTPTVLLRALLLTQGPASQGAEIEEHTINFAGKAKKLDWSTIEQLLTLLNGGSSALDAGALFRLAWNSCETSNEQFRLGNDSAIPTKCADRMQKQLLRLAHDSGEASRYQYRNADTKIPTTKQEANKDILDSFHDLMLVLNLEAETTRKSKQRMRKASKEPSPVQRIPLTDINNVRLSRYAALLKDIMPQITLLELLTCDGITRQLVFDQHKEALEYKPMDDFIIFKQFSQVGLNSATYYQHLLEQVRLAIGAWQQCKNLYRMFDIEVHPFGVQKSKDVPNTRIFQLSRDSRIESLKNQNLAQKQLSFLLGATAFVDQSSMATTSAAAANKKKNGKPPTFKEENHNVTAVHITAPRVSSGGYELGRLGIPGSAMTTVPPRVTKTELSHNLQADQKLKALHKLLLEEELFNLTDTKIQDFSFKNEIRRPIKSSNGATADYEHFIRHCIRSGYKAIISTKAILINSRTVDCLSSLVPAARYGYKDSHTVSRNRNSNRTKLIVDLSDVPQYYLEYVKRNCQSKDAVKTVLHFEHKKQHKGHGPTEALNLLASALCEYDSSAKGPQKNFKPIASGQITEQFAWDTVLKALQKRLTELPSHMPLLLSQTHVAIKALAAKAAETVTPSQDIATTIFKNTVRAIDMSGECMTIYAAKEIPILRTEWPSAITFEEFQHDAQTVCAVLRMMTTKPVKAGCYTQYSINTFGKYSEDFSLNQWCKLLLDETEPEAFKITQLLDDGFISMPDRKAWLEVIVNKFLMDHQIIPWYIKHSKADVADLKALLLEVLEGTKNLKIQNRLLKSKAATNVRQCILAAEELVDDLGPLQKDPTFFHAKACIPSVTIACNTSANFATTTKITFDCKGWIKRGPENQDETITTDFMFDIPQLRQRFHIFALQARTNKLLVGQEGKSKSQIRALVPDVRFQILEADRKDAHFARLCIKASPYASEITETQVEEASVAFIPRLGIPDDVRSWLKQALGMSSDHFQIIKPSRMADNLLGTQQLWEPVRNSGFRPAGIACQMCIHHEDTRSAVGSTPSGSLRQGSDSKSILHSDALQEELKRQSSAESPSYFRNQSQRPPERKLRRETRGRGQAQRGSATNQPNEEFFEFQTQTAPFSQVHQHQFTGADPSGARQEDQLMRSENAQENQESGTD